MTADEFRAMALSLPDTKEASHMNHPDFRVAGTIFATLGYPSRLWAMVALTPEDQARFTAAEPDVFEPVKGGWGEMGATKVRLSEARTTSVRTVLKAAWRHRVNKRKSGPARRAGTKPGMAKARRAAAKPL